VPLGALCEELAAEFAALPRAPGVVLRWEPVADETVVSDRRKLRIILKNLVANALKFTAAGEIVVACRMEPAAVVMEVRDTGVGIAPEQLPHVFDMFWQGDSSDRRSYGGVGLGLYIVRRLVEQLGGTIRVASRPREGSIFT